MDRKDVIDNLNTLIQLDIDAMFAYGQAIEEIREKQIRDELLTFRGEHERHVRTLSERVRQLGGEPPSFSRDFKGFLIEGFTAIRSMTGTKGALNAMETNEQMTNRTYGKHAGFDYPPDIRPLIHQFLGDEQKHLTYIRQMLQLLKAEHPAERIFHVVPHEPEGWWIETEGTAQPAAKVPTKEQALQKAREMASTGELAKIVVHTGDGGIESEESSEKRFRR